MRQNFTVKIARDFSKRPLWPVQVELPTTGSKIGE